MIGDEICEGLEGALQEVPRAEELALPDYPALATSTESDSQR
jgi:hypothetical protein